MIPLLDALIVAGRRLRGVAAARARLWGIARHSYPASLPPGDGRDQGAQMTQLVFVHGVNTRETPAYKREREMRDDLFTRVGFTGAPLTIINSYWGGDASSLAFKEASLPRNGQGVAAFSLTGGFTPPAGPGAAGGVLAETTKGDFRTAVDALFVSLVESAEAEGRLLTDPELALFTAAADYAVANPQPAWLTPGMSDTEFVVALTANLPKAPSGQPAAFGLGNSLLKAAGDLVNGGRNLAGRALTALFRDTLNPFVAAFLGDVFVYLREDDRRNRIRAKVIGDLTVAHQAQAPGEKLVVIGHSLGGVILYDLLSDRPDALPKEVVIDLLVTVGSQPGLFEELKLFTASDDRIPDTARPKAPRLDHVGDWVNVYDPIDLFGFRAQPMFEGCEDFVFSSATGLIDAHTAYFKRPQFHQRLNARLRQKGII